jgi:NADH:ubiquinone oxidoreductase subunit 2 (subunit N)
MPFAATALIVGGLSLAAIPSTAGFPGRWALFRLLATEDVRLAFLLLLASVSVMLSYARGIAALFHRAPTDESLPAEALPLPASLATEGPREAPAAMVILSLGIALIMLLGLFPQLLLPAVTRAAEAFVR